MQGDAPVCAASKVASDQSGALMKVTRSSRGDYEVSILLPKRTSARSDLSLLTCGGRYAMYVTGQSVIARNGAQAFDGLLSEEKRVDKLEECRGDKASATLTTDAGGIAGLFDLRGLSEARNWLQRQCP
jgi:hypothetical protein